MSKSCKGLAMELVKCLSESDCVKAPGGSIVNNATSFYRLPAVVATEHTK